MSDSSKVHSMTGFASIDGTLADGRGFGITMKAVNHRHLDLSVRVPGGLDALEPGLRRLVKEQVRRGHVELTVTLERGGVGVGVDERLLGAYVVAFKKAAKSVGIAQEPDLNAMLKMPGVMAASSVVENLDVLEGQFLRLAGECLDRFDAARAAEGEALAVVLRQSMHRVRALSEEAAGLRQGAAAAEMARLRGKMAELLAGVEVGEDRLLAEAAVLVARGDIEEELVRLRTHAARFVEILAGGGEVGRQLDFLLQEMNREANTTLSKTGGAGEMGMRLTDIGMALKVELERAREQVQNLE